MDQFLKTLKTIGRAIGNGAAAVWRVLQIAFRSTPMRVVGKCLGFVGKMLLTVFLIGMIAACVFGVVLTVYVLNTFSDSQEIPDLARIMDGGSSVIYTQSDDGTWVETQRLEGEQSMWVDLEDIPDYMQKAVVAIEDERFYMHDGVDWKRTGAAVINQVLGKSTFGGSTITQQLIKVVTQDNEVTIERKIREIFCALELERDYYTKDDILEAYLNILPLSDNVVGVGAAARYYFGKELQDLSLAECAIIAGITNRPSYYDPIDHPDHAKERQELILGKMYELGFITADEYRQAYSEELQYNSFVTPVVETQDYYVDLLIEDVIADLQEQYGYNYSYAEKLVYRGGLRIYSYEDKATQDAVEEVFRSDANFPDSVEDESHMNAAIFIMDYNGRVVATVGSRGEKEGNRVQNIATQNRRQPGSTIKPISVFAPAMDLDMINYSTLVRNMYIHLPDGTKWPINFGSTLADRGYTTVQHALRRSYNTVPAQILNAMGLDLSYKFLTEKLHFTSLVESDRNYAPLALGGFTYGVTVREMTAGYQIFGNGGVYNKPYTYNRVELGEQVLLQHIPEQERVISPETATVMNQLLQNVVYKWNGTAAGISGSWSSVRAFAKTGTTTDNKDSYFAGGTPYFVSAIWTGYDDNTSMNDTERGYAKTLWSKCMKAAHDAQGLTSGNFEIWGDVQKLKYDSTTGLVTEDGDEEGYYKTSNIPYTNNIFGSIDCTPLPPEPEEDPSEGETDDPTEGDTDDPAEGGTDDPNEGGTPDDPPNDTDDPSGGNVENPPSEPEDPEVPPEDIIEL